MKATQPSTLSSIDGEEDEEEEEEAVTALEAARPMVAIIIPRSGREKEQKI